MAIVPPPPRLKGPPPPPPPCPAAPRCSPAPCPSRSILLPRALQPRGRPRSPLGLPAGSRVPARGAGRSRVGVTAAPGVGTARACVSAPPSPPAPAEAVVLPPCCWLGDSYPFLSPPQAVPVLPPARQGWWDPCARGAVEAQRCCPSKPSLPFKTFPFICGRHPNDGSLFPALGSRKPPGQACVCLPMPGPSLEQPSAPLSLPHCLPSLISGPRSPSLIPAHTMGSSRPSGIT